MKRNSFAAAFIVAILAFAPASYGDGAPTARTEPRSDRTVFAGPEVHQEKAKRSATSPVNPR